MTDKQYLLEELKKLVEEYIQDRGLKTYRDDPVDYCEVFKNRYSKYINRIMQFLSNEFFNWQEYVELYIEKSIRKQVAILNQKDMKAQEDLISAQNQLEIIIKQIQANRM